MKLKRTTFSIVTVASLLCVSVGDIRANEAPAPAHVPLQKSIGQTTKAQAQVYPSLIVFNSRGASLQGGKLTLTVSPRMPSCSLIAR